jgi:hypothetical protein
MTVTISLPPELEKGLHDRAALNGQSVEQFVVQLVEKAVLGRDGVRTLDPSPSAGLPSDEALAPFRREVAESGMTDEELRTFFEDVREEVYQEKHGRPHKAS